MTLPRCNCHESVRKSRGLCTYQCREGEWGQSVGFDVEIYLLSERFDRVPLIGLVCIVVKLRMA